MPYSTTLYYDGNTFQGQHFSSLRKFVNYGQKSLIAIAPGACIIKIITTVIYGLRNELECLSLASLSSLVYCLGTNTLAYYGNRKLRPQ
jgi:hypothetical protein